MKRGRIATLLVMLLTASIAAQVTPQAPAPPRDPNPATRPQPGKGRIQGRVMQADTTTPVRRAWVQLSGAQISSRRVTTDNEGRYEFSELPPGQFTLTVSKGGYLTLQYGQRRTFEPGRTLSLASGQQLSQVDVSLPRAGAISGRVTDRFGEPAVGVSVGASRYQYSSDGERRLTGAAGASAARTNDLGEFRIFGLMPGAYLVSATPRTSPASPSLIAPSPTPAPSAPQYVQTYSPGTANAAEAQEIVLAFGQEASTQFQLVVGRMSRLAGRIVDSLGQPAADAELALGSRTGGRIAGYAGRDGSFVIPDVAPGEHFVQVWLPARDDGSRGVEAANVPVTATGSSVDNLFITTTPALTASGTVEWQGTAPRANQRTLLINPMPTNGPTVFRTRSRSRDNPQEGAVGADNTFQLAALQGRLRLSVSGVPDGWIVKSITVGNADVMIADADAATIAGAPIRVVMTDRVSTLSGAARDAKAQAATDYVVVLMPADPMDPRVAARFTHVAQSDQKGAFRLSALAPGRYVAVAVEALETGAHWDPSFQATARNDKRAQRVTIEEGQTLSLTLDLLQ
jgi:hypothetical protein